MIDPETGEITGYTTSIGGADTVFPFSGGGRPDNVYMVSFTLDAVVHAKTFTSACLDFIPGYQDLTLDDIHVQLFGGSKGGNTGTYALTKEYNPSTGIFKIYANDYGPIHGTRPAIIVIKPSLVFWPTPTRTENNGCTVIFDLSDFDRRDDIDPYRLGVWMSQVYTEYNPDYRPQITYDNYILTLSSTATAGYSTNGGYEIFSLY